MDPRSCAVRGCRRGVRRVAVVAAWIFFLLFGLPELPASPRLVEPSASNPHGFPLWLRASHFVNLFLMVLLVRSGLSILHDHPRLYWNDHSTPGSGRAADGPLDPDGSSPARGDRGGVSLVWRRTLRRRILDTLTMQNALHPETLLGSEINYEPLSDFGAARKLAIGCSYRGTRQSTTSLALTQH